MATATLRMSSLQGKADDYISVVVCYVPTLHSSRAEKDKFCDDMQNRLRVRHYRLLLLGDFNARVGLRHDTDDEWAAVRKGLRLRRMQ